MKQKHDEADVTHLETSLHFGKHLKQTFQSKGQQIVAAKYYRALLEELTKALEMVFQEPEATIAEEALQYMTFALLRTFEPLWKFLNEELKAGYIPADEDRILQATWAFVYHIVGLYNQPNGPLVTA